MPDSSMPSASALLPDTALDVLLVDDAADERRWLQGELERAGMRVRCAASGEAALQEIAASRPEAVLLDVVMPGLDGFETCARLRERDDDLPVIFMTGLGETEHVVRGFEVGANDFVTKPLAVPEVIARTLAHTRTARLVRATREAIDATDRAMIAIDRDRVLWLNDAARRLLGDQCEPTYDAPRPDWMAPLDRIRSGAANTELRLGNRVLDAHRIAEPSPAVCVVALALRETAAAGWAPAELTARESEVLLWVGRGKTNRDIAEILGMSPRTVNKHLKHIFAKLGVETRTAAAAAARRLKLE
jgi:DNA-binding NarL/FixJ family response regulator